VGICEPDVESVVPIGKSNPNIAMVYAAEDRLRFDVPDGVDGSSHWRILVQRQVCSALIVVDWPAPGFVDTRLS
jgi:hypothetical protein